MKLVTTVAKIPMEQMEEYREWVENHGGEVPLPREKKGNDDDKEKN